MEEDFPLHEVSGPREVELRKSAIEASLVWRCFGQVRCREMAACFADGQEKWRIW